ncbi:hypothetical protein ACLX1H_010930 [Fusarium chlamydosporum]
MIIPTMSTNAPVIPGPTLGSQQLVQIVAKRGPSATAPGLPCPTLTPRGFFNAFTKFAKTGHISHLSNGLGGEGWESWMMWLAAGTLFLAVIIVMYMFWKKRDYKWRRAELEKEAQAAFEGKDDEVVEEKQEGEEAAEPVPFIHSRRTWTRSQLDEKHALDDAEAESSKMGAERGAARRAAAQRASV